MKRPTIVFGALLDDIDTRKGRFTSYVMYLLNLFFVGLYVLGTFSFSDPYSSQMILTEFLLAIIFSFEYISRLDFAENTWEEATNVYSIADLLAVIPALLVVFIPALGSLIAIRSLQFLRILRFVRFSLENDRFFNYDLSGRQVAIAEVITMITIILFVHAGLVLAFESGVNPQYSNFWDAFYYSVVALTTTGFGNTVPQTVPGKLVTSVGLIFAITVIPWLAIRGRNGRSKHNKECSRCGESHHVDDPNYCHKCGEEIN